MKSVLFALLLISGGAAAGYAVAMKSMHHGPLAAAKPPGPSVATFDGGAIGRAELEATIAAQPAVIRDQLRTPAARKALVDAMVRTELLARAAEERKLHHEPAFVRRYKEEIGRALVEAEVGAPQRKAPPTDAEVRAFFDEHQAKLGRPERARVAVVAYAAQDELAARFGAEVAAAAFALRGAGEFAPAVVASDAGFHAVKLLGREDGYAPALDELKERICARLAEERRAAAEKAFLDRLVQRAQVRVEERALRELRGQDVGGRDGRRGQYRRPYARACRPGGRRHAGPVAGDPGCPAVRANSGRDREGHRHVRREGQ